MRQGSRRVQVERQSDKGGRMESPIEWRVFLVELRERMGTDGEVSNRALLSKFVAKGDVESFLPDELIRQTH